MIEYKAFDWDIISFSVEYFSKLKIRAALKLTKSRRLSMRDNGNIKNNSNIRIADKKKKGPKGGQNDANSDLFKIVR